MKINCFANSVDHYGWVSIGLHWFMAIALIGMYFLGDYMVQLDYYDPWYHKGPTLHKAIGVILSLVLIFRLLWVYVQKKPVSLEHQRHLKTLAKWGHLSLYCLIAVMLMSGYLIATAKGKGIDVFGFFEVPALFSDDADRGEMAGEVHAVISFVFIFMVVLHALVALRHHFVLKDPTLKRMLWVRKPRD